MLLRKVIANGSQAAGLFIFGASDYVLDYCVAQNTMADGIHHTYGSKNGLINQCRSINVGDDGHAVVSYSNEAICTDIRSVGFVLRGQTSGRGMSVVGGQNITYDNFDVADSWGAGLYLYAESNTGGLSNVKATNGQITRANHGWPSGLQHGVVLVGNAHATNAVAGVYVTDVESLNAADSIGTAAGRSLTLQKPGAGSLSDICMERIDLRGTTPLNVVSNPAALTGVFHDIDLGRSTTAARKAVADAYDGCTYWDTTLGLRGYCNGTNWKNGAGANI